MSDFWSGLFLLGTIFVGLFLGIIGLLVALFGKQKTYLNRVFFWIVFTLLFTWITDRFIAGSFCFPWECTDRGINLELLLLNNEDLSNEWTVEHTFDYAYVPRASSEYRDRTFRRASTSVNNQFYEKIYQYRSVRGASFQYNALKKELPTSYSIHSALISPQFNLQTSYASKYDFGCVFYDTKNTVCYYLARYDEYVLLLEMRFLGNQIIEGDFVAVAKLADKKISNTIDK